MVATFWLAPWVWTVDSKGTCWRGPAGTLGTLDLRPLAAQARAGGTPQGFGLFVLADGAPAPKVGWQIGTTLTARLSVPNQRNAESILGLASGDMDAATALDALWNLFIYHAQVGTDRWKPIMPSSRNDLRLYLAGQLLRSEKFSVLHPVWPAARANFQAGVKRLYLESRAGKMPLDAVRRNLGYLEKVHGIPYKEFIPADVPDIGKLVPTTTVSDNFNRADEVLDAGNWDEVTGVWTVTSNHVTSSTNTDAFARYKTDLSSSNNYGQIDFTTWTDFQFAGPCFRYQSGANTCYYLRVDDDNASRQFYKDITGTSTALGSGVLGDYLRATPFTVYGKADGTTLDGTVDSIDVANVTDSAIDTGTRVGLYKYHSTLVMDNFAGGDLGAAPAGNPYYYYRQQ